MQEALVRPVVADGGSGSAATPVQQVSVQAAAVLPVVADGGSAAAAVQESLVLPPVADGGSGLAAAAVQGALALPVAADGGSDPVPVPVPWVVSGRSVSGLGAQAARLAGWVKERAGVDAGVDVTAVGRSLVSRRALLEHRAVVWGRDAAELAAGLERLAEQQGPDSVGGGVGVRGSVRCAVLFTGQGAQRWGMGRGLYGVFPVFASALDEVCQLFDAVVSFSVRDAVLGRGEVFDVADTGVGQPVLFAFEVALFRLWCSWGVGVEAVAGHSLGGVTAAWAAGVLSLSDAVALVAARGRLMGALPSGGAMLAVGASEDEVAQVLVAGVEVASVNGPSAVVVSGLRERVEQVAVVAAGRGWRTSWLRVSHAFHSALMDPVLAEFEAVVAGLGLREPSVALVSDTTGAVVGAEVCESAYWVRHVRAAVRFSDVVGTLRGRGVGVFVEVGPDSALTPMVVECLAAADSGPAGVAIGVQRRGRDQVEALTAALGQAFSHGVGVDWSAFLPAGPVVDLPTYAFQHQRYWLDSTNRRRSSGAAQPDEADDRFWEAIEQEDIQTLTDTLDLGDREPALRDVLPALSTWRRRRREHSTTDQWRYRIVWKPMQDAAVPALTDTGVWLLVVPDMDSDLAATCTRELIEHGIHVSTIAVTPSDERERVAARLTEAISTLSAHHADTTATAEPPITGVLSLIALDNRTHPDHPHIPAALAATLTLTQALGDAGIAAPLWCVTAGAVSIGAADPAPDPAQAQICGLGRVIALEHPDRWGGLIDLPATPGERALARLRSIVTAAAAPAAATPTTSPEDQLALRDTGTFTRRLLRAPQAPEPPHSGWTPHGTVLITGGTGALGAEVARWLAEEGAHHLVLTSRRGPEAPGVADLEADLTARGARVTVAACDIADPTELAALVDQMAAADTPIRAVIHAAGVGQSTPLAATTIAELASVVEAKAVGADNLDRLFPGDALDAFVLFSSIAGVWGSGGGQGAYAAANARLDALAAARRARGAVATSIAWGPWAGAGMAAEGGAREQLARRGLAAMPPKLAVAALARAVEHDETCVTIADVAWDRFLPAFSAARPRPLFSDLAEAREQDQAARRGPAPAKSALARRLAGLPAADRYRAVLDLVRTQVAGALGHGTAERIEAQRAFKDLGFDSLTAVELRDRLTAETGLSLSATLVFDYPTSGELARHLAAELSAADGDRQSAAGEPSISGPDIDTADEAIAIVGMACRYPGGVDSPEGLWQLVADGVDAIGDFPTDRGWDLERLYDPDPDHQGTSYAREGGFLYDAADFDAAHFGVSPREALAMDPQQRLLLETTWETLERAGLDPTALRGTPVGVFIGAGASGYLSSASQLPEGVEGYALTGTVASVLSGRVAYTFGFEGPAVTVDTACSSSLVALHLAAQALRSGECTMALAGGVSVMATPTGFVQFSRQRGLARDGRCKSFAAAADGTGWSEGVGVLLLERLSDARRAGHRVLAVVRGSAVNQDGASNGLTAPNGPSQQRVIRAALSSARLSPDEVDAVEAHGTGTTLGDPIEAQALIATYGRAHAADRPLWLGSVKSNIGHSAAAAGAAGVIKMVMALRHGTLPRTLHIDEPSREVDWSAGAVALLRDPVDWPDAGRPRRAGVSAFGVSGTNAHVILEAPESVPISEASAEPEAEAATASAISAVSGTSADLDTPVEAVAPDLLPVTELAFLPWTLSASTEPGLRGQAARLRDALVADAGLESADVAFSLVSHRTTLSNRAVLLAADRQSALGALGALAAGDEALTDDAVLVRGTSATDRRVVFVFPGQGSQWAGMASGLLDSSPVFASSIADCEAALAPYVDWSLTEVLRGVAGGPGLDRVDVVQPALWAVMVSLAALWRACGVSPDAVVGHSQGEIAAACVAGALSLDDAAAVVALRSRAILALSGAGGMVSVSLPEAEVAARIAVFGDQLSIAAVNSPGAVVVSGRPDALDELLARC
ncbi:MAG: SDR family NAD(P)-dependent oxidoreductase, partial [Streptomyces sp.]|nr:SDR family NAD(P)-dependent oxidoreductase [Streptomyces sp.]